MKINVYINSIMRKTMSKLLFLILAVLSCGLFSGCALVDRDTSILKPHKWGEIYRNRENFAKLKLKMTRDEVRQIMGEPIQGETFCEDHIWWYYTRTCWSDFMTTRDECTPVVFDEDDLVEGWGASYYRDKYDYVSWSEKTVKQVLE